MRKSGLWITAACCLGAAAIVAWAQGARKPGLYDVTSNMTWQQSPFPAGMQMPPQAAAAFGGGGPRTTQVCLTQAMIDKYGAPPPQQRDCQMTNSNMTPTGMTADLVCTGHMTGKGTVEASWAEPDHAKGKVHFTGAIQMGPNPKPIEWTIEYTSTYKGADCGSVQPMPMPSN